MGGASSSQSGCEKAQGQGAWPLKVHVEEAPPPLEVCSDGLLHPLTEPGSVQFNKHLRIWADRTMGPEQTVTGKTCRRIGPPVNPVLTERENKMSDPAAPIRTSSYPEQNLVLLVVLLLLDNKPKPQFMRSEPELQRFL